MNIDRTRKSLNTLIKAYKKKNREKKYHFTMYCSERCSSIISYHSLIHGNFKRNKLKNTISRWKNDFNNY